MLRILVIILAVIFSFLNILDGHSTYLVVSNSSLKNEKNPIARFIFRKIGLKPGIISIKSLSILVVVFALIFYKSLISELLISLSIADVLYTLVVINNYKVYKKVKKRKELNQELLIKYYQD